ncbi:MAG TPA: hypothetical protein VGY49_09010 [Burkholderiaceae bacterium]|jgi:hypothetical protein|nr:hypothetical protein [Burkholderiaceae bacterium]
MKQFIAGCFALLFSTLAFAKDYNIGKCPAGPAGTPINCNFISNAVNGATFSDTMTFDLGTWTEWYGTLVYSASQGVQVSGAKGNAPCSGRSCGTGQTYEIVIDSATIGGVPLNPPATGYAWTLPINLAYGLHTVAVTGHATGALWYARWTAQVHGIVYTQ